MKYVSFLKFSLFILKFGLEYNILHWIIKHFIFRLANHKMDTSKSVLLLLHFKESINNFGKIIFPLWFQSILIYGRKNKDFNSFSVSLFRSSKKLDWILIVDSFENQICR